MTNPTTAIAIKNNTGSSQAYAYVTGLDINNNYVPVFIQADGKTVYRPSSPSAPQSALGADVSIPLGAPGATTTITIPQIAGGRIWFSKDAKLTFLLNPGPAVVEPSVTNTADPNYNIAWGFCEFTYNQAQLFVNISYVDFVGPIPIALELRNAAGNVQSVLGLPAGGLDTVADRLVKQNAADGAGWDKLVVKGPDGKTLRVLSPNSGRVADGSLFQGYFDDYVSRVWSKYAASDLTINTQASWGDVTGRVQAGAGGGLLTFPNVGTFAKPSAGDIFSCSTGPFGGYPEATRDEMGALGARIAAALNRSTLLDNPTQPDGEKIASYYKSNPTNHYARITHEVNLDGRGYAFPYDDVVPSGDAGPDQAGTVFDANPELLTVTIGGPAASNGPANGGSGGGKKGGKDGDGQTGPASGFWGKLKSWLSALKKVLHIK
ncbi:glycoside hydrolase family 64 protein [Daldinia caldariorum]|uniref:glycoside hydrolase family 64 protein n=1 Tax=Daldinia caldariorum TaxID=326644 RepID=UPI00200786DB|nr:glycoside hydrolase family 64 protein [Daldinia caldariorum]KAI1469576.1 glycoside hydrolase family 64 protein [Daldinia caldariorum]